MKYKIWYKDRNGIDKTEILETEESKERLLEHAHVYKVQKAPVKKEAKAKKK